MATPALDRTGRLTAGKVNVSFVVAQLAENADGSPAQYTAYTTNAIHQAVTEAVEANFAVVDVTAGTYTYKLAAPLRPAASRARSVGDVGIARLLGIGLAACVRWLHSLAARPGPRITSQDELAAILAVAAMPAALPHALWSSTARLAFMRVLPLVETVIARGMAASPSCGGDTRLESPR